MYRSTTNNPSFTNSFQGYQPRASSLSKTITQPNQTRSPLYPIGPTLTQQDFNPIKRMTSTSPYIISKQGIKPPSYEQKYLQTFTAPEKEGFDRVHNYEKRQQKLIETNELQLKQQQKRREILNQSYEREIQNMTRLLHKNLDRKQKLLLEIQELEKANQDYSHKLASLTPPTKNIDVYEPLARKQQDLIIMKNKLLNDIRTKQEAYFKEEEEEEEYWEAQIKQKEKILFRAEQNLKAKKMELLNTRMTVEKPDFIAIEDEIRDQQYKNFMYDAKVIEDKIELLINEREQQQRQIDQCLKTKRQNIHLLVLKHQQKFRENASLKMRSEELKRVSQEMERANDNLLLELERKEKMIEKYQLDIFSLKERKDQQLATLTSMMRATKEDQTLEMQQDIESQICHMYEEIRTESSISNQLKTQYEKLYEILCSKLSRELYSAINQTLAV